MHSNYRPVQINTQVDDCPQVHVGDKEFLKTHVPETAVAFARKRENQGLDISNKTTIVSTSTEIGQLIKEELRKVNIHVKVEASGRDVGCDLAGGSRRRVSVQKYRMQKVKSAWKVIEKGFLKFRHITKYH